MSMRFLFVCCILSVIKYNSLIISIIFKYYIIKSYVRLITYYELFVLCKVLVLNASAKCLQTDCAFVMLSPILHKKSSF